MSAWIESHVYLTAAIGAAVYLVVLVVAVWFFEGRRK